MSIYLDNNATTAPSPAVIEACSAAMRDYPANPSSPHAAGARARREVERVRELVAGFLGADFPSEIVFTSGATEAIALAFRCGARARRSRYIISVVEHAAVLGQADLLRREGHEIAAVGVTKEGMLDSGGFDALPSGDPLFVSLILANNETGVVFDLPGAAGRFRSGNALFHVDATQAIGRVPVNVNELGCDYLSLSAHKFHGPKGIGILYARAGAPRGALQPGRQEGGLRGGTENTPGILGLGAAIEELAGWQDRVVGIAAMRDALEAGILSSVPHSEVNGHLGQRVCNTTNIYFPSRSAPDMVERFSRNGLYASASAACSSAREPSHVIQGMGWGRERANASIRFSLSRYTTATEVADAVRIVADVFASTPPVFEST